MRVAIITQGYPTGGGVPTVARWLRAGLLRYGNDVHVHNLASSSKDPLSRRLVAPATWRNGVEPQQDDHDPHLFHWGADWVEFESQRYRPRSGLTDALNGYDVIQVVAGGPALALAAGNSRPPKVLQVATTLLQERRAHLPEMPAVKRVIKTVSLRSLYRLEVQALRSVDDVMVENRWMLDWVRNHGQDSVTLAPPGIDLGTYRPLGAWDPTRPIVAFGRLGDSRKDWPTAVDAYERFLRATGLPNRLTLAGRGPVSEALKERVSRSPVWDQIDLLVDVPADSLPTLLASGSVFLQSSLEEGLGLAGLEAMACGLPVVATKTVGANEYVRPGENGFLVEVGHGSAEGLADGLRRVLVGDTGGSMSTNAAATCRDCYSAEAALKRFVKVYESLTSG